MLRNKLLIGSIISTLVLLISCSNQKNTATTRIYHEINTRYNIYFNAEEAYKEALNSKEKSYKDNLSELIFLNPYYPQVEETVDRSTAPDDAKETKSGGAFETTIEKCTKAIKLHSIQAKPERDPGKKADQSYREWLKQKEFNPFLNKVWLLMAKAEYQNADYLKCITTFSYITRLFKNDHETVTEARLWMAMAYLQMGWIYEAENIFRQIELSGGAPKSQKDLFASTYADYLIRSQKYEQAIPYLQEAINGSGGLQKTRLKYLLGQLYAKVGDKASAHKAFGDVSGLGVSLEYALYAQLQQARYSDVSTKQSLNKVTSMLEGMSKQKKYEEYIDQILFTQGNVYMEQPDTVNAIKSYNEAIEKSTRNGFDKAMAQIALGDIYYQQKDYIHAQPLYPEALGTLGNKYERYKELTKRSEVLDELVVYVKAIHLQDSLQTLARMPEADRLVVINKIIEDLKKQQKEENERRAKENWAQSQVENPNANANPNAPIGPGNQYGFSPTNFYFYNEASVSQGKTVFRSKWGNRKLEDNWRRKDKASTAFDDIAEENTDASEESVENVNPEQAENPENTEKKKETLTTLMPEFYLQQIPLTEQTMKESNSIIDDAYYQIGLIYKNNLGDLHLSIEAFNTGLKRFPNSAKLEDIYYQLFLIYLQLGDSNMAALYRNKLISEFPKSTYAVTLSDPDYQSNLLNMSVLENNLYQETYQAYLAGNISSVRQNYAIVKDKFPLSSLMPKFMFLNALTYAQTDSPVDFRDNLKELVDKYPESDVVPVASEMLKGILAGKTLAAGGLAKGLVWNIQFGSDLDDSDPTSTFTDNPNSAHLVLFIFNKEKVDRNELLYDVADFNFSNFIVNTFDLSFSDMKSFDILQVNGFNTFSDVAEYSNKLFDKQSLIDKIDPSVVIVPISANNYSLLMAGKNLSEYFDFYKATYKIVTPKLQAYWAAQIKQSEKASEENSDKTEIEEEVEIIEETPIIETPKETETPPVEKIEPEQGKQEEKTSNEEGTEIEIKVPDLNKINEKVNEVISNPVDGLKSILKDIQDRPKKTKEEKQLEKEEKKRLKEEERARKAAQTESEKAEQEAIKSQEDAIKQAEKDRIEYEKAAQRAKEDAKRDALRNKEEERKNREKERKEKERAQKERLKQREQERKQRLKQQEEDRKMRKKQQEAERKAKQQQRRK